MMKNIFKLGLILILFSAFKADSIYKTSTGSIKFFSHTTMEDIDATNSQVAAALSSGTGAVEFSATINSFKFKKALMEKHFQENYLESGKYPKSTFKGTVQENSKVDYTKNGTYAVKVKGKLTMHNVTKEITVPGKITIAGTKATLDGEFTVKLKDYDIKVPAQNAANVSQDIKITVNCALIKK
jgi:polyisoprenoid-binding protein YceI